MEKEIELMTLRKENRMQKFEIERLEQELNLCRNELCLRCGDYKMRHNGACDGCRWYVKG